MCIVGFRANGRKFEVLISGELGDQRSREGHHPELPKEDERKDSSDKNNSGEDSLHGQRIQVYLS